MFGDKKNKIKDTERSLISETVSIEGTINSSGAIDVAGLVKGPVFSKEIIVRETGSVTGTIEAGKEADIIASKGDPLKDVGTLMNPTFVMARGTAIDLNIDRPAMFPWPERY